MELIQIYQCLCDTTRLRIIHLLTKGALCVCHFQDILDLPQTKVSQHLAYLRKKGMVEVTRHGTWMIYRLPSQPSSALESQLQCLQDCVRTEALFCADLERLSRIRPDCGWIEEAIKEKETHPSL